MLNNQRLQYHTHKAHIHFVLLRISDQKMLAAFCPGSGFVTPQHEMMKKLSFLKTSLGKKLILPKLRLDALVLLRDELSYNVRRGGPQFIYMVVR